MRQLMNVDAVYYNLLQAAHEMIYTIPTLAASFFSFFAFHNRQVSVVITLFWLAAPYVNCFRGPGASVNPFFRQDQLHACTHACLRSCTAFRGLQDLGVFGEAGVDSRICRSRLPIPF